MVADRITVSLDDDARDSLDDLVSSTGQGNSELVRRVLRFYAANYQAANAES
jgi:metal-responsive CopG/Arc/MetJ family transcriptional regulator